MKNTPEEAQNPFYREVIQRVAGNHFEFSGKYWIQGATALVLEAYDAHKKRWVTVKILWVDNVGDMPSRESLKLSLSYLLKLNEHPIAVDLIYQEVEASQWVSNPELPFLILESLHNPQVPTPNSPSLGQTSPVFPNISDIVYRHPGWLPLWEVLDLSWQYAQFLEYLHQNGMTYPDIKPIHTYWSGNHIRIIDYNCCETVPPPGQAVSEQSQRGDIGLFGYLLLYPMLTGRDPHSQLPIDRLAAILYTRNSLRYQAPDPLIFSDVDELIPQAVKQLATQAIKQQYASASNLSQAIRQCQQRLHLIDENPDPWQKLRESETVLRENREEGRRLLELLRREWDPEDPRRLEARRLAIMSARERK